MTRRLVMAAVLLIFATSVAASNLKVRLVLSESETLPSIPVEFKVIVENTGAFEASVPGYLWILAGSGSDLDLFNLSTLGPGSNSWHHLGEAVVVKAGGSHVVHFEVSTIPFGRFLQDGRLQSPGRYRLRAVLTDEVLAENPIRSWVVASDPVDLTVRFFNDEDVEAWGWMRDKHASWSAGAWAERVLSIAGYLMTKYPNSNYVPYVVSSLSVPTNERIEATRRAISDFPDCAIRPQLMIALAEQYRDRFKKHARKGDLESAAVYLNESRNWAREGIAQGWSIQTQERASNILKSLPAPADVKRWAEEQN